MSISQSNLTQVDLQRALEAAMRAASKYLESTGWPHAAKSLEYWASQNCHLNWCDHRRRVDMVNRTPIVNL